MIKYFKYTVRLRDEDAMQSLTNSAIPFRSEPINLAPSPQRRHVNISKMRRPRK